jgi:hypothetical protein
MFIIQNLDDDFRSPCDTPMLKKFYRSPGLIRWTMLEKEVVDEVIFRAIKPRNGLMLELMARGGMRIGEVLQLTPNDIEDRKLILRNPKSGKERETVFIPQKVADHLKEYINAKGMESDQRIFPISYTAARRVVNKAGKVVYWERFETEQGTISSPTDLLSEPAPLLSLQIASGRPPAERAIRTMPQLKGQIVIFNPLTNFDLPAPKKVLVNLTLIGRMITTFRIQKLSSMLFDLF